jgi:hypothetical protein
MLQCGVKETFLHFGMSGTFFSEGGLTFRFSLGRGGFVVFELHFGGSGHVDLEGEHDEEWGNSGYGV